MIPKLGRKIHLLIAVTTATTLSVFTPSWSQTQEPTVYKTFYDTGTIHSIKRQGVFNGCGVSIATDSSFNRHGMLYFTVTYIHIQQGTEGCHDIQTFERRRKYNDAGNCIATTFFKYYYEQNPQRSNRQEFTKATAVASKK